MGTGPAPKRNFSQPGPARARALPGTIEGERANPVRIRPQLVVVVHGEHVAKLAVSLVCCHRTPIMRVNSGKVNSEKVFFLFFFLYPYFFCFNKSMYVSL